MLIQDKLYRPTEMTREEIQIFESEDPMEFDVARTIFERQNYVDPAMRGRQSFAILKKMGLSLGSTDQPVQITGLGDAFISQNNDLGDLFFNYFLKWQIPNPIDGNFKEKEGFLIVPFLGTLHLIQQVNELCTQKRKKSVGLSKTEFSLFVPTLIHHNEIQNQARNIVKYRELSTKDKITYENDYLKNFLNSDDKNKIKKLSLNLRDYGDNIIRYFRLTRYIRIRGNGYYVDLEPRRMIEISELLSAYKAKPRHMNDINDYVGYLSDQQQPRLPWQTDETLQMIHTFLSDEIKSIIERMNKSDLQLPDFPNINNMSAIEQNNTLKSYLLELQNILKYFEMSQSSNITKCINAMINIRNSKQKPSIELERQTALSLMALNDAIKIQPNYPIGDDGEPTFTAPGGMADLECYYEQFNLVCEVTMLKDRSQWYNEGQPVMRHLREFEDLHDGKDSYCLFVAPIIHVDTAEEFWRSIKYEYRGRKQKIIPLKIDQFVQMLETLKKYKEKNQSGFLHTDIQNLFDSIINIVDNVASTDQWMEQIPNELNRWEKCLLD